MRYVVTAHAIDRLRERFRLKFPKYCNDRRETESLILGQISTAQQMNEWKTAPFYVNRMGWQYGPGVEIFKKSGVYFICVMKGDVCSVRTCTPRALYYK